MLDISNIKMETRYCCVCGGTFKCSVDSKQIHDTDYCRTQGKPDRWMTLKKKKSEKERIAKEREESLQKIPNLEPTSGHARKNILSNIEKKSVYVLENDTEKTKNLKIKEGLNMEKEIEKNNSLIKESTTPEIVKSNSEKSTKEEKDINSLVDYNQQSEPLKRATLDSQNSIKRSIDHLRQLATGVISETDQNRIDENVAGYDLEKVRVICNCYKNMHDLLKVQVDAIKVSKSFIEN